MCSRGECVDVDRVRECPHPLQPGSEFHEVVAGERAGSEPRARPADERRDDDAPGCAPPAPRLMPVALGEEHVRDAVRSRPCDRELRGECAPTPDDDTVETSSAELPPERGRNGIVVLEQTSRREASAREGSRAGGRARASIHAAARSPPRRRPSPRGRRVARAGRIVGRVRPSARS